ncbi:MAG: glycyl-radical enzyme activating protein [Bacteroidales bacterium]|nr:glycyl-radical enzyme activating protein [Bacteroidales bacterium]
MTGFISNIQRFTIHDGPGIRLTVFFQGCPLSCWWCHNPECIPDFINSNGFTVKEFNEKQLLGEIRKELLFMDESGGGVTFSGGEPLKQPDFLKNMLIACREEEIHTVVDTSGLAAQKIFDSLMDFPDLFLFDLKIIEDILHRKYTGVSNRLILKNLETLNNHNKNVIIRVPLVPGITDTDENISNIIHLLSGLPNLRKINLLPYHAMAESKYIRLNIPYKLSGIKTTDEVRDNKIKEIFLRAGFDTSLGG